MDGKQKFLLASSGVLSLLLGGLAAFALNGNRTPLLGQDGYSSVKTNSITFNADDFKDGGGSIIKNGNPFSYANVTIDGDRIIFKAGSSLKRSDTSGTGFYKGGTFYGMSIKGLSVDKPSAKITHCGSTRTWYQVINNRGDGAYRDKYATAEEADQYGYHNISHSWTNNRDDDDPSSLWIEVDNPELGAVESEFSFTELTFIYDCLRADSTYSTIMARSLRDSYKFTSEDGGELPVHVKLGDTLTFKVETTSIFEKQYDYKITVSSVRNDTNATELTPDKNGLYSLAISNQYGSSSASGYTYLDIVKTEKEASPISTYADLKSMDPNGNYYLAADIVTEAIDHGTTGLSSFSGVLDGKGHKISCPSWIKGSAPCGLFENFDGIIKDLNVEFFLGYYSYNPSGIAVNMNGGLIDNVNANIYMPYNMDGTASGLVSNLNSGTIQNCDVTMVASDTTLTSANCGAFAGYLREGAYVKNCKATTLMDIQTKMNPVAVNVAGEDHVVNCSVEVASSLFDSALDQPTESEETYKGSKVTTVSAKHGDHILKDFSFKLIDSVYFYLKSDVNFSLDGTNLTVQKDKWTLVEFRQTSLGKWTLYWMCDNTLSSNSREDADLMIKNCSGFYDPNWVSSYSGNVKSTQMYVKYKNAGTKVADSLINNATLSSSGNMSADVGYTYYDVAFAQGGNLGGEENISSYVLPKSFNAITFGLKAKQTDSLNYAYACSYYDFNDSGSNAEALMFKSTNWTIYEITPNGDGTYKISASTLGATKTIDSVSMTKLSDFFSIFTWGPVGVYSTPIYLR